MNALPPIDQETKAIASDYLECVAKIREELFDMRLLLSLDLAGLSMNSLKLIAQGAHRSGALAGNVGFVSLLAAATGLETLALQGLAIPKDERMRLRYQIEDRLIVMEAIVNCGIGP